MFPALDEVEAGLKSVNETLSVLHDSYLDLQKSYDLLEKLVIEKDESKSPIDVGDKKKLFIFSEGECDLMMSLVDEEMKRLKNNQYDHIEFRFGKSRLLMLYGIKLNLAHYKNIQEEGVK